MSQMPQLPQLAVCPACAEPLEAGDNFCGGCGAALSAGTTRAQQGPTRYGQGSYAPGPDDGQNSSGREPRGQEPGGREPYRQESSGRAPYEQEPSGTKPYGPGSNGQGPYGQEPYGQGLNEQGSAQCGQGSGRQAPGGQVSNGQAPDGRAPCREAPGASAPFPPVTAGPAPEDYPLAAPAAGTNATAEGAPAAGGAGAKDAPAQGGATAEGAPAGRGAGSGPAETTTGSGTDTGTSRGSGNGTGRPQGQTAAAGPADGVSDPREDVMVGGPRGRQCGACRVGVIDKDGYCERCGRPQPRERDHMEEELADVAAVSDRGLRHHRNEDAFALSAAALADGAPAVVAVVCDGVSSATRPDEASEAAAVAARASLTASLPRGTHPRQAMHDALLAAAESVGALAEPVNQPREHDDHRHHHQNAPACTIVSAVVAAGGLTVGWIGDSRAYWVPDDRATRAARLTEDDSWAAQMVANGLMSQAEAYADDRAHAITGWLGADAYELEPHTASFSPDRPGVVVVCTDGLWNYAESAEQMAAAVPADARARPLRGARSLVDHALDGGGHDNVTVAILPFPGPSQGAGSA
ncbi:protein phosphatase 2C domain-containing protein [Streptomyces varsoviensis]|uniref:PP2C family protein-serine/threonine phosphatase n=1 Tax=Streptomyces varsoviensis TaxID=67373 RepID=UPI0033CD975D